MSTPETTHEVVVVGSGSAGLGQLLALRRVGITDVVLLERADATSSLADDHDLRRHVRLGQETTGATWDEHDRTWSVRTRGGTTCRARFLVLGTGALHMPHLPDLPGAETFAGPAFHSAQWDHDVDLRGRRVAVIGTGAGATPFVPQIAGVAAEVQLYQRTPAWVLPKNDEPISARRRRFFARHPRAHRAYRAAVYPTLARPDVEVITGGVREIREHSIVDGGGTEREVDVVVLGTGFHVTDAFDRLEITGRAGRTLRQVWAEHGMATHLGMTVSDFPNLFLLLGPDTGLGHHSVVPVIECQTHYVAQAITAVHATGMSGLDVRAEVQQRSNAAVQRRRGRDIGTRGGCTSWYLDAAGVDRTIWPGSTVRYWWRTRRFEPADFEFFGRAADAAATPTPQEVAEQAEGTEDTAPEAVPA